MKITVDKETDTLYWLLDVLKAAGEGYFLSGIVNIHTHKGTFLVIVENNSF